MRYIACAGTLAALCFWLSPVMATGFHTKIDLDALNLRLAGKVSDHTHNHGADRRIWSAALCQRRDLYVYLPPRFDPRIQYPLILWLHGFMDDEQSFLKHVLVELDSAMRCGRLPPCIIAAPDGSIKGEPSFLNAGSFFVNSNAGNYEDYVMQDVWNFIFQNYPIRPEREAHVIAGLSMGGFGAYNLGMKYQANFKILIGFLPPLNLRWVDCHGRYMGNFDPCCWGWRTQLDRGYEVIGRFYGGLVTIRVKRVIDPLYGRGPEALASVSRENPIEMIDRLGLQPGVLDMYVAYGGRDQYNVDAQVESFVYLARQRGLCVDVGYDPKGKHNIHSALKMFPGLLDWLAPRLAPYSSSLVPEGIPSPCYIP